MSEIQVLFENNSKGAEFSACRKYRYKLWRFWDESKPKAMCIGLNPSTANEGKNDQTINYLTMMLTNLGYGGFYMMNLFAWISSNPDDLLTCANPLGENESKLSEVEKLCSDVIVCWGGFKQAQERIRQVLPRYPNAKCFGVNKNGTPFHPLALMYNGTSKSPKLFVYSELLSKEPNPERSVARNDAHGDTADLQKQIQEYKEVLEDKKRLVREIDVVLNGENAAKQASLCDLVGQISELKSELEEARKEVKLFERYTVFLCGKPFSKQVSMWNRFMDEQVIDDKQKINPL